MFRTRVSKFVASFLATFALLTVGVLADSIVTGSKPFTFIPGTTISSSQVNADFDYIINQVNTNAAKNGANSSITSLLGLTTPLAPSMGGSFTYVATSVGGTANAITVSATQPAISSYSLGTKNIVVFSPTIQNTGATTLNINSTGAVNIFKSTPNGLIALQNGDLIVNQPYMVYYDGANYLLLDTPQLFGAAGSFASASTVDLGLSQSHNVSVTGTTTITSFGSSASINLPIYLVKFTGALTLTYNATSLILPNAVNIVTIANDTAWVEYLSSGNWRVLEYIRATPFTPAVQTFTSGSGTYTPSANINYIKVRMVGGGGGGGAGNTNNGTNGGTTSFGSWTAILGNGGNATGGTPGAGGTGGASGSGTVVLRLNGGAGGLGWGTGSGTSGAGGSTPFGSTAGVAGGGGTVTGITAKTNTGTGGSGGVGVASNGGSGGGGGEYVEFYMTASQIGASQAYTVGAAGTGGAAGGGAGGNGGSGIITVEEFRQ